MTTVLAAGDHFVRADRLAAAVREACGPDGADLDVVELTLPWPDVPFGRVAEVDEASDAEDEMIAHLAGAQACVTQMGPVTARVLEACPDLRFVGVGRGGPVNVNLEAATAHGVQVTRAPGRNAVATAEHTVAMMLAAARRIPQVHADLLAGTWRGDFYRYDTAGPEIAGSTVGLVGVGEIGERVASRLEGFGARVLVHDPYLPEGHRRAAGAVDLDELLGAADLLSLHARLTADNVRMIGARELALLPQGAVLVNCARAGLLDHDALCDALESGHLHAAALDVFPDEPPAADSRLLRAPRLVMTPHLAGASRQTADNACRIVAADLAAHLRGEPPEHLVNPEVLEQPHR
ncbi:Putative 2-hydroxyacid dehydrogenase YoaD [Nocardioides aquaticus]|uniref:2-hydroxyacid dehydrogenase YoaD n=1 Tax=Nocardioides aquaticus TaxID=160826 RepID=A0ABX8EEU6_9ACTN|nr:2-hydroxyacid dehydrogenase [Nocardioides aquaticus]QVT78455.1 Putative 2-hydroxyacid dehydrogenase YoaD [Nocardioides aquaticus]